LTVKDVPRRAIMVHSNAGLVPFPSSFSNMQNRPLNGVVVLTNRAVLTYFTRSRDAVSLNQQYFIRGPKTESGDAGQAPARLELDANPRH
jgi:hypothetical protein